jgi:hypothetical protein
MEIDLKAVGYIKSGIGMNWLKSINWLVYVLERGVYCNEGTAFLNNIRMNSRFHKINAGAYDLEKCVVSL